MATIKDVARMAGVSQSTVSKYINGGQVRPANVEAIRSAIAALEYRVNPFARSLKTQRSHSVGILLPTLLSPFTAIFLPRWTRCSGKTATTRLSPATHPTTDWNGTI